MNTTLFIFSIHLFTGNICNRIIRVTNKEQFFLSSIATHIFKLAKKGKVDASFLKAARAKWESFSEKTRQLVTPLDIRIFAPEGVIMIEDH